MFQRGELRHQIYKCHMLESCVGKNLLLEKLNKKGGGYFL